MTYKRSKINGNPFTYISKLVEAGVSNNVELRVGSSSGEIRLHDKNKILTFAEPWKPQTFKLLNKTKKELEARELPDAPQRIKYVGVKPPEKSLTIYEDVISLDVTAAYHQAARILGYFSDNLYKEHLNAGKVERLQSFGATAKRNDIFYLIDGELEHQHTEEGPLRPFFLNAAHYIAELFTEFAAEFEEYFLFYWVDCIFLKNAKGLKKKAEEFFKKRGIIFHDEETNFVIFETRKTTYHLQRGTPDGVKEYNFPRYEITRAQREALINQIRKK